MVSDFKDLNQIYRIVLALPMLKYFKFSSNESNFELSFPMATDEQFNSIEILVIDHPCTFNELILLVSYTPHLCQLHLTDTVVSSPKITMMSPTALPNLTHLTIVAHTFMFADVELFIKRMNFKLKMFEVRASEDTSFIHAHRWENLIVQHLPHLEKFSLFYHEFIGEEYRYDPYLIKPDEFLNSFWIQRHWFLNIDIVDEYTFYSIQPYLYVIEDFNNLINYFLSFRKQWYDYFPENSSLECSKVTKLLLTYTDDDQLKIIAIKRALKIAQIYHLEMTKEISVERLIEIIELLPELHTLTIDSLSLRQLKEFSSEELLKFSTTKNTGKIVRVCLQQMNNVNDLDFLMALCPAMTQFQVDHIENMTIASCLRYILKKIYRSLRSLSFLHPMTDDQLVEELQKIISNENLLVDYSIKRILKEIYLKWK